MKIFKEQKSFVLSLPRSDIKVVLFYGKDLGAMAYYTNIVSKSLLTKGFTKHVFYADSIKDNILTLENSLKSNDLFAIEASSKLIVIKGDFPKLVDTVQSFLPYLENTIVLIEAGDLSASSKLRTFCDKAKDVASVACYQETSSEIAMHISTSLKQDGYTIEKEALGFIVSKLGNDKMITEQEITKLKLYKLNDKNINLQDVSLAIGQNDNIAIDKIVNACYSRSLNKLYSYIETEALQSIGVIPIVRSLINHCLKMITIKLLLREQHNFESAVALIKPAIFYKQKAEISSYINLWSLKSLFEVYDTLIKQEISVKKNNSIAEIVLQNICIKIASV